MGMEHLDCNGFSHLDLKQIKLRKETEVEEKEEEEPLSPMARMFHEPESNVYVILIVGFKNPIDPNTFKANLVDTIVKHPRFSSVQVADGGEMKWVKTKVDIDNHVKLPLVDQDQDMVSSDKFVEDYVASLSKTQISMSVPMWDCHVLNLKTSDAESTLVVRVHHSLGDGTSLMSLLISCSDTLPSFPMMKKPRSTDTETPLKAPSRSVAFTSRRIVRRTLCLDDVKSVKNATNTTVNDVMLAITQAGLSRYLNRKYGKAKTDNGEARERESNLPDSIRLTATLFINMRSSPGIYALTIHIISYAKKIAVVLSVDDNIISDPYKLCDDIEEALKLIKKTAMGGHVSV